MTDKGEMIEIIKIRLLCLFARGMLAGLRILSSKTYGTRMAVNVDDDLSHRLDVIERGVATLVALL